MDNIEKEEKVKAIIRGIPIILGTNSSGDNKDYYNMFNKSNKFEVIDINTWEALWKDPIYKHNKFFKQMENKQLTEGQQRVRLTFNPNDLKRVRDFKQIMASAIDFIEEAEQKVRTGDNAGLDLSSFMRESATAKTDLQKASMAGVLALTADVVFKLLPNDKIEEQVAEVVKDTKVKSKYLPHQQRVVEEQGALATKCTDLEVFISSNPVYQILGDAEQQRLVKQLEAMQVYNTVLKERIANFQYE